MNCISKIEIQENTLLFFINLLVMDSELIKWLSQMPKSYSLSGSKTSYYNGEKQLKLFLKIKDS